MARLRRFGFTIVELLVVIAIIGVLMALLLPAVQAARESGRRTACMNNLYQLGMAVNRYDQDAGKVPNWTNTLNGAAVSWPVKSLPYIERNDLYETWTSASPTRSVTQIASLICPSSPANILAQPNPGPLAYAGNCGDGTANKYNGVFPAANITYSLGDISDGDGTSTTLLFAEKGETEYQSNWGVLVSGFSFQLNDALSTTRVPAFGIGTGGDPGSKHAPNGWAVAFCDGHTKFIAAGVSSIVYDQLVTSRNLKSDYLRDMLDESKY